MPIEIVAEHPDTPESVMLITELEAALEPFYPSESRHGYSVEKLMRESVSFFVMRKDGEPAACGGVQLFGSEYGELKRMYVRPRHRGKGLGREMLNHLADHTLRNGVRVLRLETGIHQKAASRMYEKYGFRVIPPFGDYREDPLSVFYEMRLQSESWATHQMNGTDI